MKFSRFQCLNPQIRNSTGSASRHFRTLFMALAFMLAANLFADKPRVIITSDVGGTERDDEQSFVRLLLYSNELDIVGLIGTNSQFGGPERGEVQVFKNIIDVYAGIRNNLLAHADGYPTATYLKSICKYGRRDIKDMAGVGDDKETDGSNLIIAELKKADPRPLWFCVWGSNSTLAQALWDLRRERDNGTLTQDKWDAIIAKIRIYDIAGQCTTGAWIAHTFPGIFYIRSTNQFQAFAKHNDQGNFPSEGPTDMVDYSWFKEHIRDLENENHLGHCYPKATSMYEGDSPSFVYLLSKGLNDPEKPWMGSWGGRFGREMTSPAGRYSGSEVSDYLPAPMYCAAQDTVKYNSTNYTTNLTALWRWRVEYQNDFAARMRWTETSDLSAVNHHPVAVLNGDSTQDILPLNVSPGQTVTLSAAGSTDRDSDTLSFMWWQYKEAGTYDGSVTITNNTAETTEVSIPQNETIGKEIHIVLSVKDNASPYPLTSHRRIVLTVAGSPVPTTVACVGDSITEGYPTSGTGYPGYLDAILSDNYTVLNFGKSGTTAMGEPYGDKPYIDTIQYTNALASEANVVIIMLGSNDAKSVNWSERAHFKAELQGIVDDFLDLSPAPKVYLATQVPSFNSQTIIDPVRIETYMGPRTRELANELNIQGIDTYTPFIGRSDLFKDGIHPNTSGNELLASVIQDAITAPDDHQAPSTPSGVTATAPSTTSVTLTWSASSGTPSGYEIYRGEECVKVVAAATRSFTETGLAPGIYNYQVRAFDRALNLSAKSAAVSINTNGSTPDIDPPSVPTGLSGTVSGTSITLTWNASTDNRGVSGYEVRRGTSTSIGTTASTSKVDSGLSYGSTYTYSVRAFDADENYSNYCASINVTIPASTLPDAWESRDIGNVGVQGSAGYASGVFALKAAGSDIYTNADSFGYTYASLTGDGSITARVTAMENTNEWAKCGVMIRETLEPGSKHASMVVTPRKMVSFQRRTVTNANAPSGDSTSFSNYPMWVRLVRSGDTITGSYSANGSTWTVLKEISLTMNPNVYVGLALCSHDNTRLNTATIDNVTIVGGGTNQAPVLQGIGNQTIRAGETIRFTIQATDPDAGPEALHYSAEGN